MTDGPPEVGVPVCYRHPDWESHIRCQRCSRPICPDCMRDAAVGFQCPACIAEGAKTTRSAQSAYGGKRSGNPATTTIALIGINVFVWVLVLVTGWHESRLVSRLALVPKGVCESRADTGFYNTGSEGVCNRLNAGDGRWVPGIADGSYWELLSSMFLHVEIWHIAVNMLSLWILGPQLESVLGRVRFLALYLVSGLAGSTLGYWAQDEHTLGLGASGAIFGLLGALLVIVHKIGGELRQIFTLLALNAVVTVVVPNVSWQAHLGGFLGGVAVTALLVYAPRPRRGQLQALGLGAIVALLAVAVVLRSASLA